MNSLKSLGKEIENAKKSVDLPEADLEVLRKLNANDSNQIKFDTQIKSLFAKDEDSEEHFKRNPSWLLRKRLDALQLEQRTLVCETIKDKVFAQLDELTKGLDCQEKRFAPIKGIIRALVKLTEYTNEKINDKNVRDISSST